MTGDADREDPGTAPGPIAGPGQAGAGGPPWPHDWDVDRPWGRAGERPWGGAGHRAWSADRRGRRGPGRRGPRRWGRFIGCLIIGVVLLIGLITALATWVAGTLLGIVQPGGAASPATALTVIVAAVLALMVVARISSGLVRPLASIADAAERLADGDAGVRVAVAGPGPVRRLAASFNAMAERLDRVAGRPAGAPGRRDA